MAHAAFQIVASWLFTIGFALFASALAIGTLGRWSSRLTPWLMRTWGQSMLWIAGVRLELDGGSVLSASGGKVVVFNHASMLDAFVIAAICPPGSVAAVKREALFYPGLGLAIGCLRFLIIDRANCGRAIAALDREARRIGSERLTVLIAPEGTRSRDGALLPFKRGAFHLAVRAGAPIVPVILRGAFELHPYGRWWSTPGVVRVDVLPAISTCGLAVSDVPALAAQVRARMQRALPSPVG